jgi:very-short-patch-repair endonuclease
MSLEAKEKQRAGGRAASHEAKVKAGRIGGPNGGRATKNNPRHREAMRTSLRAAAQRGRIASPSKLQLQIAYLLFSEFPSVIIEAPFGPYRVDIYLPPPYYLGFEVDGTYWHRNRDHGLRDRYLCEEFGLPIIRFSEDECKVLVEENWL